ncbi:hypothetical protein DPMN_053140 [Dreissena polymorpha]|uniref:Uncharacterized protein n=1 Tax=Dreissena polymorpha TaxID=45954 RepID=A0A9D4HQE1_DREPO|nr:hypothetical protein DPMN_053140 [Dreissena polymorpha]
MVTITNCSFSEDMSGGAPSDEKASGNIIESHLKTVTSLKATSNAPVIVIHCCRVASQG